MRPVSERDRRALLWGAAVIALAGAGRLVPMAWRRIDAVRQETEQKKLLVARAEELAGSKAKLDTILAARTGGLVALAPRLVPGANAADGAAELAAMLAR